MGDFIERRIGGMSPGELSGAVFAGRILCFEGLPPVSDVVTAARRAVSGAFDDADPLTVHADLDSSDYEQRYAAARRAFQNDSAAVRAMEAALVAAGLERDACYRDRLVLRISPPHARTYRRGFGAIPPHRDSWGSGIYSQINWWMPVYPLSAENTMAIFPAHWTKPIENDSDGWDWTRAGKDPDVPLLPTAKSEPDRTGEVRLDVAPGTLVAFSGAHLHASVPNTTPHARISCETRSVSVRDLVSGCAAPDIDGGGAEPAYTWFRRFGDGKVLEPRGASAQTTRSR